MKKLLLSARDPGAAGNIVVLFEDLVKTGQFDVCLIASGSAYSFLKSRGLNPDFFEIVEGKDHIDPFVDSSSALLEKASEILKRIRPDVVITGLSSFGAGIDEALIFLSDVPVFAVQDFWGDVNLSLGKPADVYLVMDEYAAEITRTRCGSRVEIIGSPKYSRYEFLDIDEMRKRSRGFLGASGDDKVIGWFGQHPEIPGYKKVFESFLEAVVRLNGDHIFFFREHPKFGASAKKNIELLCSKGITAMDVTGIGNAEEWISACDTLVTPFSLCGLDHAHMSAFSEKAIGTVIYLMHNSLIQNFYFETSGIKKIPLVDFGAGEWFDSGGSKNLIGTIRSSLGEAARSSYYKASKRLSDSYIGTSSLAELILKIF